MRNETDEKIRYASFKFFLEKGYEATNIRDICKVVDIKPSSLYFYYKSKQELFLSIYDEIWSKKLNFYESIKDQTRDSSLKSIFKDILNYHANNILYEKFLIRYHLFPAEEIGTIISEKYNYWRYEENIVLLQLICSFSHNDIFNNETDINSFLHLFKSFINHHIIRMITDNIKPTPQEFDLYWGRFWNSYILSIQN